MRKILILVFITAPCMFSACEKPDNEAPVADFEIFPRFGDSLTVFHLNASKSTDNTTNQFRLKARWDIYDDGVWETDFTILKSFSYKFPANGTYYVKCEIIDDEKNVSHLVKTLQVAPVPRDSVFTDTRDGMDYKAVFLFDRWWMRENLQFGSRLNPGNLSTDNSVPEYYLNPVDPAGERYGGYYTWNEATDYGKSLTQGICPEGWRMPVINDISRIKEILSFTKNYAPYLAEDEEFMLDLALTGKYFVQEKIWHMQGTSGNFWINHKQPVERFLSWIFYRETRSQRYTIGYYPKLLTDYQPLDTEFVQWQKEWGSFDYHKVALPVRCVKDHEIN